MIRAKFLFSVILLSAALPFLNSCGSGGSGDLPATIFDGVLLDSTGAPIPEAGVFIYQTAEGSITDEQGRFYITSYKHLVNGSIYFQTNSFSNKIDLGQFPEETLTVRVVAMLDSSDNSASLVDVKYLNENSPPPADPIAPPEPEPGSTPNPDPAATPKPLFDSNGNTNGFGIPAGLTGNVNAGRAVWSSKCASCHAAEKTNRSYGQTKVSLRVIPTLQSLHLSNSEIANVTAYLNRNRR